MTEQAEVQIKILRLNTGEDIIGCCLMDDEHGCVSVENPMKVFVRRSQSVGQSMLFILPWLPLEIVEDNFATINYDDIITVIEPKQSFVEYYNEAVEQIEAKELEEKLNTEEEDDEEEDVENMQEMLNALRESKKNRLH